LKSTLAEQVPSTAVRFQGDVNHQTTLQSTNCCSEKDGKLLRARKEAPSKDPVVEKAQPIVMVLQSKLVVALKVGDHDVGFG